MTSTKPRLRIFAGPNGAGKSTLYQSIKDIYFSTRIFVNADLLENSFKTHHYIDFSPFGFSTNNKEFQDFRVHHGQYLKAQFDLASWNLEVRENVLISATKMKTFIIHCILPLCLILSDTN